MVRRIHDHHGGPDGRISDCDCPNPLAPEPVLGPREGRVLVPTFLPGPGEGPAEPRALVRLRPEHIGPAAVVVGAASYAITATLAWWLAVPLLVGLLALLVHAGRRGLLEVDRMATARALRR